MSRYRTKPVAPAEVEARQVTDATADEIAEWCDAFVYTGDRHGHTEPPWQWHTCITLCEPDASAFTGYWVVRHPDGTFEVCDPAEFAERFEAVTDDA